MLVINICLCCGTIILCTSNLCMGNIVTCTCDTGGHLLDYITKWTPLDMWLAFKKAGCVAA